MADIDFAILQQSSDIMARLYAMAEASENVETLANDSWTEFPMSFEEGLRVAVCAVDEAMEALPRRLRELAHTVREAQREYVMRCQEGK